MSTGIASMFMPFEPLDGGGWSTRDRCTNDDSAKEVSDMLDSCDRESERLRLVSDNLNNHTQAPFMRLELMPNV